jgi:endogenous inhibitor of DNA gyrase (YacG/DUF329 family)
VAAFDMLVAEMRCPICETSTPLDSSTEMQTKLRPEPDGSYIGVGDRLPTDPDAARNAGYLILREPAPDDEVVLLQTWRCPHCGTPFQWAEVVVRDGLVSAIEPVALDAAAIARAHYAVDDAKEIAATLAGLHSIAELSDEEAVQVLLERVT